jgi:hypothetical protein
LSSPFSWCWDWDDYAISTCTACPHDLSCYRGTWHVFSNNGPLLCTVLAHQFPEIVVLLSAPAFLAPCVRKTLHLDEDSCWLE